MSVRMSLNRALRGPIMPLILNISQALLLEHLGLARIDESLFEVSMSSTWEHKRSRGHPWGSRNKPKEEPPTCPSSPASFVSSFSYFAPSLPSARKGKGLVDQGMIVCSTFTSFMSMAARFYFFYMVIPPGVLRRPHWRNFK